MGQTCSTCTSVHMGRELSREDSADPAMYDIMRKSILATTVQKPKRSPSGQHHLMYKNQYKHSTSTTTSAERNTTASPAFCPTRLVVRRNSMRNDGEGVHIYAVRYPEDVKDLLVLEQAMPMTPASKQEQCPPRKTTANTATSTNNNNTTSVGLNHKRVVLGLLREVFTKANIQQPPSQQVVDWVTVSQEHSIFIADIGLTSDNCDHLVTATEQACRGQYAAYTYAKQTLGCREYPSLMQTCFAPVHTTVHAIAEKFPESKRLQLDDREPHIVKYDITKKERQKLDMHTDKSEWTFLIALSNGCGVDYEGGGTYFECLDATIHLQRGHALIFPGKLRHCGKKISGGLRFLLVGFLVDKSAPTKNSPIQQQDDARTIEYDDSDDKENEKDGNRKTTAPSPPGAGPFDL